MAIPRSTDPWSARRSPFSDISRRTVLPPLGCVLAAALWVVRAHPLSAQVSLDASALFELVDHAGRPFPRSALAGRPYAIFFGFTHCPDVCPTTLLAVSTLLQRLGPDAERVSIVFVTVDPERDTPELMRLYLTAFDPRIIGLTGRVEQIAAVARTWNAFHNKIPEDDGTYTVVHSAYIYLMDHDGRLTGTMSFQDSEEEQLARLKALIARTGGG